MVMSTLLTGFLGIMLFFLGVALRVLLILTVNFDAKSLGVKNTAGWMALIFFFPLIAGIVYLALRKKSIKKTVPKMCTQCGVTVDNQVYICPNCMSNQFVDYQLPDSEKNKRTAKTLGIVAIVVFVLYLVCFGAVGYQTYHIANAIDSGIDVFEDYAHDLDEYFEDYAHDLDEYFDDYDSIFEEDDSDSYYEEYDPSYYSLDEFDE